MISASIIQSNLQQMLGLFNDASTSQAAIKLTVLAFAFGVLAMGLICRMCRRSRGYMPKSAMRPPYKKGIRGGFEKYRPAPADGSIEIYVGNLSYDLTEEILRKEFAVYGKVNSARIITNRYNGRSKGFGFVHMANAAEASAAVKGLNDKDILGRKLKCNEARNVV